METNIKQYSVSVPIFIVSYRCLNRTSTISVVQGLLFYALLHRLLDIDSVRILVCDYEKIWVERKPIPRFPFSSQSGWKCTSALRVYTQGNGRHALAVTSYVQV